MRSARCGVVKAAVSSSEEGVRSALKIACACLTDAERVLVCRCAARPCIFALHMAPFASQTSPLVEDSAGGAISISANDVAVKIDDGASADREAGDASVKSRRTVTVCSGGYSQKVEESFVGGDLGPTEAQVCAHFLVEFYCIHSWVVCDGRTG